MHTNRLKFSKLSNTFAQSKRVCITMAVRLTASAKSWWNERHNRHRTSFRRINDGWIALRESSFFHVWRNCASTFLQFDFVNHTILSFKHRGIELGCHVRLLYMLVEMYAGRKWAKSYTRAECGTRRSCVWVDRKCGRFKWAYREWESLLAWIITT